MIADPVGHSLSPAIHNACFADQGMNRLYLPLLVQGGQAEFDQFLDNILARPWLGFPRLQRDDPAQAQRPGVRARKGGFVEPLADKIGAANTLIIEPRATERRATPLGPTTPITPGPSTRSRPAWGSSARTCEMCRSRWSAQAGSPGPSSRA